MKRRTFQALLIASLVATTALAPVAFRFGKDIGAARAALASQIGDATDLADAAALARESGDCDLLGFPSAVSRPGVEIDCMTSGAEAPPADPAIRTAFAGTTRARQQAAPSSSAFAHPRAAEAVTGASGGNNAGAIGDPFSLALAPDASEPLPGAEILDPTLLGGSGLPLIFTSNQPDGGEEEGGTPGNAGPDNPGPDAPIPDSPAPDFPNPDFPGPDLPGPDTPFDDPAPDEPPFSEDPPVIVTPVPGALPLIITGIIGLWAASGRRKP